MAGWRKSSYSDGNGGNCVETADRDGQVLVRDTADSDGTTLNVPAAVWERFTDTLK